MNAPTITTDALTLKLLELLSIYFLMIFPLVQCDRELTFTKLVGLGRAECSILQQSFKERYQINLSIINLFIIKLRHQTYQRYRNIFILIKMPCFKVLRISGIKSIKAAFSWPH